MAQPLPTDPAPRLRQLAELLRDADHLPPEALQTLADLLEELSTSVAPGGATSERHLAESVAHLVEALHQRHDTGFLAGARRRLEEAAVKAEAEAPVATGIVRRLIDTLANLGI